MDLDQVLMDVRGERDRLKEVVVNLERLAAIIRPNETVPKRPGRKSMDKPGREEVSERMKRYWSRRRSDNIRAAALSG
jgi:hypothetical protein